MILLTSIIKMRDSKINMSVRLYMTFDEININDISIINGMSSQR